MISTVTISAEDWRAFLILLAFLVTPIVLATLIHFRQCRIAREVQKELEDLHARRLARVRAALASDGERDWTVPTSQPAFPFEGWVHLTANGVEVAGETLNPSSSFQVVSKDERNIARAKVVCKGGGVVLIASHGEKFRAVFQNKEWTVEQLPDSNNEHPN